MWLMNDSTGSGGLQALPARAQGCSDSHAATLLTKVSRSPSSSRTRACRRADSGRALRMAGQLVTQHRRPATPAPRATRCRRSACLEHCRAITLAVNNALRYAQRVLQSFRDKDTERVWRRQRLRKLDESTQRMALRKLLILDAADALADLRVRAKRKVVSAGHEGF